MSKFTKVVLEAAYDVVDAELEFGSAWNGPTGYFDAMVKADLGLSVGEIARTKDGHGRRLLVIGHELGNIVLFERYTDADAHTVCINCPEGIKGLLNANSLSVEKMTWVLEHFAGLEVNVKSEEEPEPTKRKGHCSGDGNKFHARFTPKCPKWLNRRNVGLALAGVVTVAVTVAALSKRSS